ncbi:MAG: orotidine-5'-phosphate decarboxylase [Phycisphaerales bacterium]|nr:orotidine-5'-phosphate decarboxylase [Phycisphaerales bacterium]MCB9854315.1 orotidine-5'-phosphate decarboxylase [Phycisphaerales bacterium]MCB9863516.1 orotidine-5'-phosphate decarboxylase [Phycisphaerales bacterium]
MSQTFAERVLDAVRSRQCCGVVNIDPVYDRLPKSIHANHDNDVGAMEEFSCGVVDAVAETVPIVKFNIAYFERYGSIGLDAYLRLAEYAHSRGLLVIGDIKRGDVGHTAEQYALASFSTSPFENDPFLLDGVDMSSLEADKLPDAVTINGYFGWDGVQPFVRQMESAGRGVFVLVRTSNESAASVQDLVLEDGRKVHEAVGALVNQWSAETIRGGSTYGSVGAVVATRNPEDAARLRRIMPNTIFLVPGYGAQGGTAEDFRPYLDSEGLGALIAAGRSVIYAHAAPAFKNRHVDDWQECVRAACRDFAADLARIKPE